MEQLSAIVIGAENSGKSHLISTAINIPFEKFNKNIPFQELKNENIPVLFIEANKVTIEELNFELDTRSRNKPVHVCWYVLPGSIEQLSMVQIEEIRCLSEYFERITFVFTEVTNLVSSKYMKILTDYVENPAVVLLSSCSNSSSVITYENTLTTLINSSYSLVPQELQESWQILVDLRQRKIFHNVDNKPPTINYRGMQLLVQDTDIGHLNIILAGQVGVGKSALVNAILGKDVCQEGLGKAVTHEIKEYEVENMPITVIDSPGFELGDNLKNYDNIINLIHKRKTNKDVSKHIHLCWYCINENSARVQLIDLSIIQKIGKLIPVFIVLTQSILKDDSNSGDESLLESLKNALPGAATYSDYVNLSLRNAKKIEFIKLSKSNIAIHRLSVKPTIFVDGSTQEPYGLKEFIDLHRYYLEQMSQYVLNASQEIDIDAKACAARSYILLYAHTAGHINNKSINVSDADKYIPIIQEMLIGISSIVDIPIYEGSIPSLTDNLFVKEKDSYGKFRFFIGFIMGFAEKALLVTFNPVLSVIGKGIGVIRNFIFPYDSAPSLFNILNSIGIYYLETVIILKKNGKPLDFKNFMEVYTENIQLNSQSFK